MSEPSSTLRVRSARVSPTGTAGRGHYIDHLTPTASRTMSSGLATALSAIVLLTLINTGATGSRPHAPATMSCATAGRAGCRSNPGRADRQASAGGQGQPTPIRPDSAMTPGAALAVSDTDVCTPGYSSRVRNVTAETKRAIYAEYGITEHAPGDYEIDHLISLELGGSNARQNLWPESYHTLPWNARVKDALENRLHRLVCAHTIALKTAQDAIALDWIAAYRKYMPKRRTTRAN